MLFLFVLLSANTSTAQRGVPHQYSDAERIICAIPRGRAFCEKLLLFMWEWIKSDYRFAQGPELSQYPQGWLLPISCSRSVPLQGWSIEYYLAKCYSLVMPHHI